MTRTNEFGQQIGDATTWAGARTPEPVVLEGRWVRLEPLTIAHAPGLLLLGAHPELWTYLGEEPPADLAAAEALTRTVEGRVSFAIVSAEGRFLGRASYLRIQPTVGSIEVGGILYAPELQRTPAATEVQYLLARHAFGLGFRRYEWKCDALNAPSRRAALRLGFREEGTWRRAMVVKGRSRDTTWFAMTDQDWPTVRSGFQAWLDEVAARADGTQTRSLEEVRNSAENSAT